MSTQRGKKEPTLVKAAFDPNQVVEYSLPIVGFAKLVAWKCETGHQLCSRVICLRIHCKHCISDNIWAQTQTA